MYIRRRRRVKVREIVKKIAPNEIIGIMKPGLREPGYIGRALGAVEREDLMSCEVAQIGREIISNVARICIYTE